MWLVSWFGQGQSSSGVYRPFPDGGLNSLFIVCAPRPPDPHSNPVVLPCWGGGRLRPLPIPELLACRNIVRYVISEQEAPHTVIGSVKLLTWEAVLVQYHKSFSSSRAVHWKRNKLLLIGNVQAESLPPPSPQKVRRSDV